MVERVRFIAENHAEVYRQLWYRLRGVTDPELDWRIHPEANTVRWVVAHLLFIEEWTADVLEGAGRYLENRDPKRYDPEPLEVMREQYDRAFARTQANLAGVGEDDFEREVDMLGAIKASLLDVLENHVHHTAGHMYQVRFIRGTYSRAFGTDKKVFDGW